MPNTYVEILGTQPSKNGDKHKKEQIGGLLSALSALRLRFISREHQSAMRTAFIFNLVLYLFPEQSF